MTRRPFFLTIVNLILFAGLTQAQRISPAMGSLMARPVTSNETPVSLSIQSLKLEIEISGRLAKTTINETFRNHTLRQMEGIFTFPLPEGASISYFGMSVGDKMMNGEIVERVRGRKIYESIVSRRQDPGILESMGGNIFKARVFPIPADGEKRIRLSYCQLLSYNKGRILYHFPMNSGQENATPVSVIKLDIKVYFTEGGTVLCPTHNVQFVQNENIVTGIFEEAPCIPKDILIQINSSQQDKGCSVYCCKEKESAGYFLISLAPGAWGLNEKMSNCLFMVDTSASVRSVYNEEIKLVDKILSTLSSQEKFNIVTYDVQSKAFSEQSLAATTENKETALRFLKDNRPLGGTNLEAAIDMASSLLCGLPEPRIIVFIGDANATLGERDSQTLKVRWGDLLNRFSSRLFVAGIGNHARLFELENLAASYKGKCKRLFPGPTFTEDVDDFSHMLTVSCLCGLKLSAEGIHDLYPNVLPSLTSDDELLILGRYEKSGPHEFKLSGELDGRKIEISFTLDLPEESNINQLIPRFWASCKIEELSSSGSDTAIKETIELSRKHWILTEYTTFLVLESEEDYKRYGIERDGNIKSLAEESFSTPNEISSNDTVFSLVDKNSCPRSISDGGRIKPGTYLVDVHKPGYSYPTKEEITIKPGTKVQHIRAQLFARPRPISLKNVYKDCMLRAREILVNGRKITADDVFKPGEEIDVVLKYDKYETVHKKIKVIPGHGEFILPTDLREMVKYEFKIRGIWLDTTIDGITYPELFFTNDTKPVEEHHINKDIAADSCYYMVLVPWGSLKLTRRIGYKECNVSLNEIYKSMEKTDRIDLPLFIEHYNRLQKEQGISKCLESLERLLRSPKEKKLLSKSADCKEIENLLNLVSSWHPDGESDKTKKEWILSQLRDWSRNG